MSELSRRQFLRRAGGGAVSVGLGSQLGWLAGCGGGGSPAGPDWEALDSQLRGSVVLPDQRDFTRFARPLNRRYEHIRAAGVAVCAGAGDVAASVRFAREADLPIAVRSGGHNYAGYCASRGLVIDLGRMRRAWRQPPGAILGVRLSLGALPIPSRPPTAQSAEGIEIEVPVTRSHRRLLAAVASRRKRERDDESYRAIRAQVSAARARRLATGHGDDS